MKSLCACKKRFFFDQVKKELKIVQTNKRNSSFYLNKFDKQPKETHLLFFPINFV